MGHDASIPLVFRVAVALPVSGVDMDFDVTADTAALRTDDEHGVEEVGPGFKVPSPRVLYANLLTVRRLQYSRAQGRVVPDALQMAFGERECA